MKLCNKAQAGILDLEQKMNHQKPSPLIEKPSPPSNQPDFSVLPLKDKSPAKVNYHQKELDKKAKEREEFKAKMMQDRKKNANKKNDFFVEINNVPVAQKPDKTSKSPSRVEKPPQPDVIQRP